MFCTARVYVALNRALAGKAHADLFSNKTRDFSKEDMGGKHDLQGNNKQPKSLDTAKCRSHKTRHHLMTSLKHSGIHLLLEDD